MKAKSRPVCPWCGAPTPHLPERCPKCGAKLATAPAVEAALRRQQVSAEEPVHRSSAVTAAMWFWVTVGALLGAHAVWNLLMVVVSGAQHVPLAVNFSLSHGLPGARMFDASAGEMAGPGSAGWWMTLILAITELIAALLCVKDTGAPSEGPPAE